MKTDAQIQTEVMQELKWDPSVTHEHIGVSVVDAIVTLSGTIPSYIEKIAAEKAAQRVYGVKAVVENIEVKLPYSNKKDDQDIAKSIANQFKWSVQIPEDLIKVTVEDGWVKLVGEVDWEYQRTAAESSARGLTGVRGVTNNIYLKAKKIQADTVKQKIEEALKREAVREAQKIKVEIQGSTVKLSGEVHSFTEMNDAKWAAWSAPGVTKIENNLHIGH
jgi:osmotically-inducible protein OsmY